MNWLSGLWEALPRRDPPAQPRTVCDAHGVTQSAGSSITHIAWQDVTSITGYKKDCYMFDQIRVEIRSKGQNIVCGEGDQGFSQLGAAIATHLPGSMPNWILSWHLPPHFKPLSPASIPLPNKL